MAEAKRLEARPGVLAVSLFPVQPWLDIPDTGFSVMAVADGPRRAAEIEPMVRQLAWQAWERRRSFAADLLPVDEAIRRALAARGRPVRPLRVRGQHGVGLPRRQRPRPRAAPRPGRPGALPRDRRRRPGGRACHRGRRRRRRDHDGRRHARPALQPSRADHRAGPHPLRRPLRLDGQEDRSASSSRWGARRSSRSGASPCWRPSAPAFTFDPALYRSVGLEPRDAKIVVVKSPAAVPRRLRRASPGRAGSSTRPARARPGSSASTGTTGPRRSSPSTTTSSPRSAPSSAPAAVTDRSDGERR